MGFLIFPILSESMKTCAVFPSLLQYLQDVYLWVLRVEVESLCQTTWEIES